MRTSVLFGYLRPMVFWLLLFQLDRNRYTLCNAVEHRRVGRTQLDQFLQLFGGNIRIDFELHPYLLKALANILGYAQETLQIDIAFQSGFHGIQLNAFGRRVVDQRCGHTGSQGGHRGQSPC